MDIQKAHDVLEDRLRCEQRQDADACSASCLDCQYGFKNIDEAKEHEEALCVAIFAVEKQIPKKPIYEGDGYADGSIVYDTWICPNCESQYEVEYDEYGYCPHCGQAIEF